MFRTADTAVVKPSAVGDMPDSFWPALQFFVEQTDLSPKEAARIVTQFKEVSPPSEGADVGSVKEEH